MALICSCGYEGRVRDLGGDIACSGLFRECTLLFMRTRISAGDIGGLPKMCVCSIFHPTSSALRSLC
jgi:hypothetical protein